LQLTVNQRVCARALSGLTPLRGLPMLDSPVPLKLSHDLNEPPMLTDIHRYSTLRRNERGTSSVFICVYLWLKLCFDFLEKRS
jgi:hypothetical protein